MEQTLDLDAYFARIGYTGSREPALSTLAELHLKHACTIPFENLNPFLGLPVSLDVPSLQAKLVDAGRGGYCFEHNILFSTALRQLGFEVTWLGARVVWMQPDDSIITPRTHMTLQVRVDGTPYLADVGFGGLVMTAPIRLEADVEQETPHEPFRIIRSGTGYIKQARIDGRWTSLYRFDLHEQYVPDYEIANWYVSSHPKSLFVNGILAARVEGDRRYALFNNQMAIHRIGHPSQKSSLDTVDEFRSTLQDAFRIRLPDAPNLNERLQFLIDANG